MQMGWFNPKAGQLPQKRPDPQSVGEEHGSRTWQLPLEQAVEMVKKMEEMSGKRKHTVVVGAMHFER